MINRTWLKVKTVPGHWNKGKITHFYHAFIKILLFWKAVQRKMTFFFFWRTKTNSFVYCLSGKLLLCHVYDKDFFPCFYERCQEFRRTLYSVFYHAETFIRNIPNKNVTYLLRMNSWQSKSLNRILLFHFKLTGLCITSHIEEILASTKNLGMQYSNSFWRICLKASTSTKVEKPSCYLCYEWIFLVFETLMGNVKKKKICSVAVSCFSEVIVKE